MIIYPSESFVSEQKLSEKKLNTYFDISAHQQSANNDTIFSEEGVPVFVVEANGEGNKDSEETFHYTVLPVIDFVCFEVFNQKAEAKDTAINLKTIITQWTNYVQAVRSHTSLYPTQCKWQKHNLDMNENQLALYSELESLLLTDDLKELDDIIRVSCGAAVNANSGKVTEFQLASTLAQNFSQLAKASNMLKQGENCAIEKAALEVKCEKLNADVTAIENIAAENKAQRQRLQKEAESLRENNFSQAQKLESVINEKQQSEEAYKNQLLEAERELVKALQQKDNHIAELKKESELAKLQIIQLQEELETYLTEKQEYEAQHKTELKLLKEELSNALVEQNNTASNAANELEAENELMQLQIVQLQEELEFYFEKANIFQVNDSTNYAGSIENRVLGVAEDVSENHNTLKLINRLMTEQGREK